MSKVKEKGEKASPESKEKTEPNVKEKRKANLEIKEEEEEKAKPTSKGWEKNQSRAKKMKDKPNIKGRKAKKGVEDMLRCVETERETGTTRALQNHPQRDAQDCHGIAITDCP